jgi:uncharacterized YigZ family protein
MLFSDTYLVPAAPAEGSFKDKGSRFLAYVYQVRNEDDVRQYVQQLKKEHPAANHHCYAYVLGADQAIQKANDDREPSNTAGKPILRHILSKQLTNTLVVVVRYFGGRLLGVPGLIQAYGEAAADALKQAQVEEKVVTERHELVFDFEYENEAFRIIKQYKLRIVEHLHGEKISIIFEVRRSQAGQVIAAIRDKRVFETTFKGQY